MGISVNKSSFLCQICALVCVCEYDEGGVSEKEWGRGEDFPLIIMVRGGGGRERRGKGGKIAAIITRRHRGRIFCLRESGSL